MSSTSLARIREVEYPETTSPSAGVYLDAASYGLLPRRTREAVRRVHERRGDPRGLGDLDLMEVLGDARAAAARLLGCEPEAITLAPNTSYGINLAAHLVAAGPPGTIVVSHGEFPANVHPWLALEPRGFRVKVVGSDRLGRPDSEALKRALEGEDVRALALSVVQFANGVLSDVKAFAEVCRDRDVLLCLDAIQAAGIVPLDVTRIGADVLATGGHKWLCSPWGSGFTYIRPELRDRFDPPMVSWLAKTDALDFAHLLDYEPEFLPDGRKFELATLGIQDHRGMARSLELLLEVGVEKIRAHVEEISSPLVRWARNAPGVSPVTPIDPERRAGIFSFRVADASGVHEALSAAGFTLALREGALRVAPHLYNTLGEMEELVERLSSLVR